MSKQIIEIMKKSKECELKIVIIKKVPKHSLNNWIGKMCYAVKCTPPDTWCILKTVYEHESDPIIESLCSISFPTVSLEFIGFVETDEERK